MTFRYKTRWFVSVLTVLVLFLAPAGSAFADGGGHGLEQEIAGYHVQLVIEGKAVTGENEMAVKLFDAQEQPVTGAEVEVHAEPAGEHEEDEADSEHTESEASEQHAEQGGNEDIPVARPSHMENIVFEAGETPGEYHGGLDFSEPGSWTVTVHFATPDTKAAVHFNVEVASRVNKNILLGGFAGINASVIIAAAILKRRTALVSKVKLENNGRNNHAANH